MFNQAIIVVFYSLVACSLFFGLLNVIRSNIYDIKQSKLRRERAKHPHTRKLRQRPMTSVIVYASNNSARITDCLSALTASSYKKLEIITIDNASSDNTAKLVREFIKQHPKTKIRLVAKKKVTSRQETIKQASKYAQGQLIAVIDANCVVDKQAIKNCVLRNLHTEEEVLLLNIRPSHDYSLMGLADSLKAALAGRAKKADGLITPGLDSHNYASIYTYDAFQIILKSPKSLDNINYLRKSGFNTGYESLAAVNVHGTVEILGASTASRHKLLATLQMARNALAVLEPFLIAFMVYVAIKFNNTGYIVLAWISFTSLLALAIWSDETQNLLAKLRLTFLALVAYGLYLIRQLSGYANLVINTASR